MRLHKNYTHLFFDLDNTLWDFEINAQNAMQIAFSKYELHYETINFQLFFRIFSKNNHLLWKNYRKGEVGKKELVSLRFQQTFDELRISGIDPLEINEFYLNEMPKQKCLLTGTEHVLRYLKSNGYEMYIITNGFTRVQHQKLEAAGIHHYFRKIYTSEEIRSPKPAREIFDYAIKSSNARKSTSLMIGDDFETDVLGALAYGIDAVFLDRQGKFVDNNNAHISRFKNVLYKINTLEEILPIL